MRSTSPKVHNPSRHHQQKNVNFVLIDHSVFFSDKFEVEKLNKMTKNNIHKAVNQTTATSPKERTALGHN